jgi:hypothetical protein
MRALTINHFAPIVTIFLLIGCRTSPEYHGSAIYCSFSEGSSIKKMVSSSGADLLGQGVSVGGEDPYDQWTEIRLHFTLPTNNADAFIESYHVMANNEITKQADESDAGETFKMGDLQWFHYSYRFGKYKGNIDQHFVSDTNGGVWAISYIYEHLR